MNIHYTSTTQAYISSDKHIAVYQFINGDNIGTNQTDPSMITIPAISHWSSKYAFTTPITDLNGNNYYTNYVSFAVKETEKFNIEVDRIPLSKSTTFKTVPGTDIVCGYVKVDRGEHYISSNVTFQALIMGKKHLRHVLIPRGDGFTICTGKLYFRKCNIT